MPKSAPPSTQENADGLIVNLADMPENKDRYSLMIQTFVPRPIAWVLTENENGTYNLAPFSYTAAVAPTPMTFMVSCGMRRGGTQGLPKDTWANLERTKQCVLHIPSAENVQAVNDSASGLEVGASEINKFGIETTPFDGFPLPRVKTAPIAFGCALKNITCIGTPPLGLILLEAEKIFMAKHTVTTNASGSLDLDAHAINPLTRLGKTQYATLGKTIDIGPPPRPK